MNKKTAVILGAVIAAAAMYAGIYALTFPSYTYVPKKLPEHFEDYYRQKLEESARAGVRPGNEEKLLRVSPGKTPVAILYIHGFTASRAEGEAVMDAVARRAGANIYYLRLTGHGIDKEALARCTYRDFLDSATDAMFMMPMLGKRVVIAGTSMGGTIATWLAANYPDTVNGIILCSPFFESADPTGRLFEFPGGLQFVEMLMGKVRVSKGGPEYYEGWQNYWYVERYYTSYKTLFDLKKLVVGDSTYRRVNDPVLLVYYYRDKQNQDANASVPSMLHAFNIFGTQGKPNPLSRAVVITDGEHVLMSRWVKSDKKRIEEACVNFVKSVSEGAR